MMLLHFIDISMLIILQEDDIIDLLVRKLACVSLLRWIACVSIIKYIYTNLH